MKNSNSILEKTKRFRKVLSNTLNEKTPSLPAPTIDYPREGEQILPGCYTIRISCDADLEVQVTINDGEWQPCRWAVGHYWLDWEPDFSGRVKIVCRSRSGKGRWKIAETRMCEVV